MVRKKERKRKRKKQRNKETKKQRNKERKIINKIKNDSKNKRITKTNNSLKAEQKKKEVLEIQPPFTACKPRQETPLSPSNYTQSVNI